jgi:hypothetical protein
MILISLRGCVNPRTLVRLEGLDKLKNFKVTSARSRNLPACSVALRSSAPPLAHLKNEFLSKSLVTTLSREPTVGP